MSGRYRERGSSSSSDSTSGSSRSRSRSPRRRESGEQECRRPRSDRNENSRENTQNYNDTDEEECQPFEELSSRSAERQQRKNLDDGIRSDKSRSSNTDNSSREDDDGGAEVPPKAPPPPKISKMAIQFGKPGTVAKPGIKMKLAVPKPKAEPAKKITVASAFNDDDEEIEQMPAECKMRMRNIGRDTPTSSGPNSFGKTKQGFVDSNKLFERSIRDATDE